MNEESLRRACETDHVIRPYCLHLCSSRMVSSSSCNVILFRMSCNMVLDNDVFAANSPVQGEALEGWNTSPILTRSTVIVMKTDPSIHQPQEASGGTDDHNMRS
ncbi:hypothetical protein BgiMline_016302 [Biomphalaria glabrata]